MTKALLKLSRLIDWGTDWIGKITALAVMAMILIGAWNVVGRYVGRWLGLNLSSNTLIELQWQLFAAVFLLGAAVTLQRDQHVRMDVFYKDFTAKRRAIANLFGIVIFLMPFTTTLLWVSWRSVYNSCIIWERSPNPGGLPLCPAKLLVIMGGLLLLAQAISELIKSWSQLQVHRPKRQVSAKKNNTKGGHPHD